MEKEVARPDPRRAAAALAVVGAAVALAVLPALFATGVISGGPQGVIAVVAGLAAVVGGVKAAAMAWGLAAAVD